MNETKHQNDMKKRSLPLKVRNACLSFPLLWVMSYAHAQSTEPAPDAADAQLLAKDTLRQESMRMRATTVLPGHTIQTTARPPSKKVPKPSEAPPTKAWGEYATTEDGLEAFKKTPVILSLHDGQRLTGNINYYTSDAVLFVTEAGDLHIIELTKIRGVEPFIQAEPSKLSLSEDAAQSLQSKHQQAIRDKIRDYRLREAHQHIGRPLRVSGGTLLGVGALAELWGLTVLTTTKNSGGMNDGPFGNSMAVPVTIIGAPLIATGIGLIIGANLKRKRAIDEARKKNIRYSVAPTPMGRGAGTTVEFTF